MGFENRGRIGVKNLEIVIKKGLYPSEELIENQFLVSAYVEYDTQNLKGIPYLNYEILADILKEEMQSETRLLEKIAEQILDRVFELWPFAYSVDLRIEKQFPSFIHTKMEAVVVELKRIRN